MGTLVVYMCSGHVVTVLTFVCLFSALQVERFGKPTWRRLVEAVKDRAGCNNVALAQTIAGEHPGVLP